MTYLKAVIVDDVLGIAADLEAGYAGTGQQLPL